MYPNDSTKKNEDNVLSDCKNALKLSSWPEMWIRLVVQSSVKMHKFLSSWNFFVCSEKENDTLKNKDSLKIKINIVGLKEFLMTRIFSKF